MASLTPIESALYSLLEQLSCKVPELSVSLTDAQGAVLANDQVSGMDVPLYDNSAMDGYAINTEDLEKGSSMPVSQVIAAGHPGGPLTRGSAARIFTGAPIPEGANAVVIQENTEADGDQVTILKTPSYFENIRSRGHDIEAGKIILSAGHRLRAQDLGLLASVGLENISVRAPLTVAILNTGDEVIPPGQALQSGQLYDSNSFTLEGMISNLGIRVIKLGIVEDSLEATRYALNEAAQQADCVISTGGVSVGDEDHVKAAVESLGELNLWKLAIKPGKPFSFGYVNHTPFFGLPGNPVAVFVTFSMLVRACLLKLQGAAMLTPPCYFLPSGFELTKAGSRQEYLRVRLTEQNGEQVLTPFGNQGSSIMTSLSWADGLAVIPINQEIKVGQKLAYYPFDGLLS